jgi:hypothetical protein
MEIRLSHLKLIRWFARILTLLFAAFLCIFAGDVFEEKYSFWMTIFALFMHLIPAIAILVILWISWRYEWVGGVFYPLLGGIYVWWAWDRFPVSVYFLIAGPLFLLGGLYFISWHFRRKNG